MLIEDLAALAVSNGIWAVLFCGLLVYQLKDSRKREHKYQSTIESLHTSLNIVHQIKENVERIMNGILRNKRP